MKHVLLVHCCLRRFPVILARMRSGCLPLIALLSAATPALAQITVDLHALDALPGARPPPAEQTLKPTRPKPEPRRVLANKPSATAPEQDIEVLPPVTADGGPRRNAHGAGSDAARRDTSDRPAAGRCLGTDRPTATIDQSGSRATASSGVRYGRQRCPAERRRPDRHVWFQSGRSQPLQRGGDSGVGEKGALRRQHQLQCRCVCRRDAR